ncbi:MAG: dinitrogenase iron-molybdenum cofactor biosynthesis protein [Methanosphaera stadtmanae]|nr:dinitrogenase iron-molybdenum cofactor biosynthesis protein [Methanosphaera stadtmanae]
MKKIAVSSKENGKVEHFGKCEYFLIYNYDENTHTIEYENVIVSSKDYNGTEEWEKSANAIEGCDIVICEKIGMVAKANVELMGMKVIEDEGTVENVLDNFIKIETNKNNIIL